MALRHMLLGLLDEAPMHGYLLRRYAREYSWMYPMSNANIYPALHSLEADGFIAHDTEIFNGRVRKTYHILDAGREELRRWLLDPAEQEQSYRDQLLLKIAMLSDDALPGATTWIRDSLEACRQEIDDHAKASEDDPNGKDAGLPSRYAKLTRDYAVDLIRLRAEFLERVLEAAKIPA